MSAMHVDTFKLNSNGVFVPYVRDEHGELVQVAFAPMDGAQEAFMCAPEREVGLAGNRGGGKTQIMLADYLSGVGRGWGSQYKGVLIRRSQREFTNLITLSESMIRPIWPKAAFNKLKNFWQFPDGETLEFSYFDTPDQFSLYQGKSFVYIMFEELTLWPTLECYLLMFSCLRSPIPNIPRKVRFTCNPSGPGHNAVRHRFNLFGVPEGIAGPVITEIGKDGTPASRRIIYASFEDTAQANRTGIHAGHRSRVRRGSRETSSLEIWRLERDQRRCIRRHFFRAREDHLRGAVRASAERQVLDEL